MRGPRGACLAFGRLRVVMLVDGDPRALECSASPRAAEGSLSASAPLPAVPAWPHTSLASGSCRTTVHHLFPSGSGQESLRASLQAESAPRARADTCAPRVGHPVCALCEHGTVALD